MSEKIIVCLFIIAMTICVIKMAYTLGKIDGYIECCKEIKQLEGEER